MSFLRTPYTKDVSIDKQLSCVNKNIVSHMAFSMQNKKSNPRKEESNITLSHLVAMHKQVGTKFCFHSTSPPAQYLPRPKEHWLAYFIYWWIRKCYLFWSFNQIFNDWVFRSYFTKDIHIYWHNCKKMDGIIYETINSLLSRLK